MQEESQNLNLEQALDVLRRRVLLVALCVLVVGGAAYAYSKHQTKKYTTTASLAFSNNQLSQQVAGLQAVSSGNPVAQQASNIEHVRLGDMAKKTAKALGQGLTEQEVASDLSIGGAGESSVVSISATAASPVLAAEIANTYAREFVTEQTAANKAYFRSALSLVSKQLQGLSTKQRVGPDGLALQNRAQSLGLLSELNYGNVQVAQEASTPTAPSSPKTSRNAVLGALLGLVVGLALAFLLERLDRRIRRAGELEDMYRLPTLGVVPRNPALARPAYDKAGHPVFLKADDAEAFHLIRAHLRYLGVNRNLHAILLASAELGDGNTTIARHLATAAAQMGSRVLLLEADLRQPMLTYQLGLQPGPGLADVLIGGISMHEAIRSIELEMPAGARATGRTLDVLTAGSLLPPNPAELLESRPMEALLDQVKAQYDLVIVDAPPLTTASDAFPLLAKIDGVAIVGRVGRSRRDAAERLHHILEDSGAVLLGIITNGAAVSRAGSPEFPKSHAEPVAGGSANGVPEQFVPAAKA